MCAFVFLFWFVVSDCAAAVGLIAAVDFCAHIYIYYTFQIVIYLVGLGLLVNGRNDHKSQQTTHVCDFDWTINNAQKWINIFDVVCFGSNSICVFIFTNIFFTKTTELLQLEP